MAIWFPAMWDGMGMLKKRKSLANAIIITYTVPSQLARYMIEKGSVAVDGTSLTINRCDSSSFLTSASFPTQPA